MPFSGDKPQFALPVRAAIRNDMPAAAVFKACGVRAAAPEAPGVRGGLWLAASAALSS